VDVSDELAWVLARSACEQLLARFHGNADAGRATDSLGLLTPDAALELPMVSARGTDEIRQALAHREALTGRVTLHAAAGFAFILASPDAASAGGGLVVYAGTSEGVEPVPETLARYSADFRRLQDGWRIARLRVRRLG
jgi:hypothetical protein